MSRIVRTRCHAVPVFWTLLMFSLKAAGNDGGDAQDAPSTSSGPEPQRISVSGSRHYNNAVGSSDAASAGTVHSALIRSRPAQRTGEVLEFVPGVIVTQHSGDGKANQYFLRGFNLDHGTDFATFVDGVPVNMPSHGHGQGYTDLNFLIPELVDRIHYRKGPYFARSGDFSAAGSAEILYRRNVDAPLAALTMGEHGLKRALFIGSATDASGRHLLGAAEAQRHDGPWILPEQLRKANGVLSVAQGSASAGWDLALQRYEARWRSTDQIPERGVESGRLGRFSAVDDTDRGETSRSSLSASWRQRGDAGGFSLNGYVLKYRLGLYSNFSYATKSGGESLSDQFEQRDSRAAAGAQAVWDWTYSIADRPARSELGMQWRRDRIHVGLHDSSRGQRTSTLRDDDVHETSLGFYGEQQLALAPWIRGIAGLRADQFRFAVRPRGAQAFTRADAFQLSPKVSFVLGPLRRTELFVNAGRGFHSNDARGVTDRAQPVPGLVPSRGWELGLRTEAARGLQSSIARWQLRSESELLYVGDAGTTEPSRASRRSGVEWNNRWVPAPWLLFDADLAWTRARWIDPDPAGDRIPGAVGRVASVVAALRELNGWSTSMQWRYLGPRPLVEDGSIRARSSLTTNLRVARRLGADATLTLDVFNVGNKRANDIEYFYESQLPGEPAPVADRHIHPVEPRTVRIAIETRL